VRVGLFIPCQIDASLPVVGVAGPELTTPLGHCLGPRGHAQTSRVECARLHRLKPLFHEVAADSLDPRGNNLRYFAEGQVFRARLGESVGLNRARREKQLIATLGDEARDRQSHSFGSTLALRIPAAGSTLSLEDSAWTKALPFVLSIVAGSVDTIGFLGLGGLFTAHITGNLIILAARFFAGGQASIAHLISIPVFVLVVFLTRSLAVGFDHLRLSPLVPLLLLQFLLISGFFVSATISGAPADPTASNMIFAGMLGVSAMAVQNALIRVALADAPSTAVMTTNVSIFAIDIGEMLLSRDPITFAKASRRARRTWPAIVGFLLGCVLGGACEALVGLRALALPTGVTLVAFALGVAAERRRTMTSLSICEEISS